MTSQDDLARPWFQPSVPPSAEPEPDPRQRPAGGRPTTGPMTTRVAGELSLDEVSAPAPRPPGRDAAPERVEVTQPYIPAISEHAPDFAKRPPSPGSGASTRGPAGGQVSGTVSGTLGSSAGTGTGSSAEIDVGYGPRAKEPVERLPLMSEIAAADPAAPEAVPDGQGALTRPGDFTTTGQFAGGSAAGSSRFAAAPAPPAQPTAPQPPAPQPTTGGQAPGQPAGGPTTDRQAPAKPAKKRSLARRVVRRIIGPDLLRKDPPKSK